jgi:glycosyltransferase involved in cell wall biosynthesis
MSASSPPSAHPATVSTLPEDPISLTIIVPIRNGATTLRECLRPLKETADAEIIVIDDASSDGSAAIAGAAGVTVIRCAHPRNAAAARNMGAAAGRGTVFVFVDADVVVHRDALARIVRCFRERPEVTAVFGSYDDQPPSGGLVSRYRNLLHHYFHQRASARAETFWSGLGAIRAAAFRRVGGFAEGNWPGGSIEDIEFGRRLTGAGLEIRLDRALLGTHLKEWTARTMVVTDVFLRALPWSRLILREGAMPNTLNTARDQRASVILACLAPLSFFAGFYSRLFWLAAPVLVVGMVALNRQLFALLRAKGGWAFMLGCIPLHLVYLLSGGLGFGIALGEHVMIAAARRIRWRERIVRKPMQAR